jgi:hypothetical protein
MKRMRCIGAQEMPLASFANPPQGVETACRRKSGSGEPGTFFRHDLVDRSEAAAAQIPLFEESALSL